MKAQPNMKLKRNVQWRGFRTKESNYTQLKSCKTISLKCSQWGAQHKIKSHWSEVLLLVYIKHQKWMSRDKEVQNQILHAKFHKENGQENHYTRLQQTSVGQDTVYTVPLILQAIVNHSCELSLQDYRNYLRPIPQFHAVWGWMLLVITTTRVMRLYFKPELLNFIPGGRITF